MENKYGLYRPGSSGWTWLKNEEFQEEHVWGAFQDSISRDKTKSNEGLQIQYYPVRPSYIASEPPRIIGRSSTTRPLTIPRCSETYDNCLDGRRFAQNRWNSDIEEEEEEEEEEEDYDDCLIPPHIWIAKKIQPSSSVCQGAGRTLKGRDLLSVRNAVLTKTGFLESQSSRW